MTTQFIIIIFIVIFISYVLLSIYCLRDEYIRLKRENNELLIRIIKLECKSYPDLSSRKNEGL